MRYLVKMFCLSFLCLSPMLCAEEEKIHNIAIEIKINCRMSEELEAFVKSIPRDSGERISFGEWKVSFINNMTQLINLVESEKIGDSFWSANVDLQTKE